MTLNTIFVTLSSILTITAFAPYIINITKGKSKPRVMSWFIWSVLSGIACGAALIEHQYSTVILLLASLLGTSSICIIGWKYGNKTINNIDIFCLISAIVGIVMWIVFNSPAVAVIAMIIIDFIAGMPTLIHSWRRPNEETVMTFILSLIGALFTLLTISDWRVTAYAFPLFLVLVNLLFASVLIFRRLFLKTKNAKSSVFCKSL